MPFDSRTNTSSQRDIYGRYDHTRKRTRSRSRSRSPQTGRRHKDARWQSTSERFPQNDGRPPRRNGGPERFTRDHTRKIATEESEQLAEWVAQEDSFVLKQAKKKAVIRVKEGRAKPIDWLAVNLRVIDPERDPLDDEIADEDLDVIDPEGVLEGLDERELRELAGEIDTFLGLEQNPENKEYWNTMKVLCSDKLERSKHRLGVEDRAVSSVAEDIDRLLSSKSFEELQTLENQISRKLNSNEPIDVDYWSQLLKSLRIWKAKASLKKVYSSVIKCRLDALKRQQAEDADIVRRKLEEILENAGPDEAASGAALSHIATADPEPILKLPHEDRNAEAVKERDFLTQVAADRQRVVKLGYVPMKQKSAEKKTNSRRKNWLSKPQGQDTAARFATVPDDEFSQATHALYEREVARGVGENEEIFVGEEEVVTSNKSTWADKYRPRKPRYFNRVQMGYEWNKYNQTHYDHDNPPPKVVQGYKFNIFYPDLIDKSKAPTYRIEREGGRKRGQSFAPAGEDDTCLIRFIAGPPYEDLAFRIVDKEWDYSAKKERGFKSSFDKGILQLHFQLKKVYYRK